MAATAPGHADKRRACHAKAARQARKCIPVVVRGYRLSSDFRHRTQFPAGRRDAPHRTAEMRIPARSRLWDSGLETHDSPPPRTHRLRSRRTDSDYRGGLARGARRAAGRHACPGMGCGPLGLWVCGSVGLWARRERRGVTGPGSLGYGLGRGVSVVVPGLGLPIYSFACRVVQSRVGRSEGLSHRRRYEKQRAEQSRSQETEEYPICGGGEGPAGCPSVAG